MLALDGAFIALLRSKLLGTAAGRKLGSPIHSIKATAAQDTWEPENSLPESILRYHVHSDDSARGSLLSASGDRNDAEPSPAPNWADGEDKKLQYRQCPICLRTMRFLVKRDFEGSHGQFEMLDERGFAEVRFESWPDHLSEEEFCKFVGSVDSNE